MGQFGKAFARGFKEATTLGVTLTKWGICFLVIALVAMFVHSCAQAQEMEKAPEEVVPEVIVPEVVIVEPNTTTMNMGIGFQRVPFKVYAQAALVIDAATGEIIYNKNGGDVRSIASITKLMSAVVTLDANLPLDEEIRITQEEVDETTVRGKANCGRHAPCLGVGMKLTRAEVLHIALMNSNNRAAYALARSYPGGVEAFVTAMNAKAQMLGMDNTKYVDPTGLYSENMSTPADLAVLLRHASDYVVIRDFSTSPSFGLTMYNKKHHKGRLVAFQTTNRLVKNSTWNIVLQKTGYIRDAGHCLAMMAQAGGKKVLIVLLNTVSNDARADDAIRIKQYIETGDAGPMNMFKKARRIRHHNR